MKPILRNINRLKYLSEHNSDLSSLLTTPAATNGLRSTAAPSPSNSPNRTMGQRPQTLPPQKIAQVVSSLQDDIKTKKEFKFSRKLEQLALTWLIDFFKHYRSKLTRPYKIIDETDITLHSLLCSGELLCELANILNVMISGSILVPKINHSPIAFLCLVSKFFLLIKIFKLKILYS